MNGKEFDFETLADIKEGTRCPECGSDMVCDRCLGSIRDTVESLLDEITPEWREAHPAGRNWFQ